MPDTALPRMAGELAGLVEAMPGTHVRAFAESIAAAPTFSAAAAAGCQRALANPAYRGHADRLLAVWRHEPALSGAAFALAVLTALEARDRERASERIDLVATGPATPHVSLRQTRAVVLEIVSRAEREILLVSFSAYRVPELVDALRAAAERGAVVRVIVETEADSEGFIAADARDAFGSMADRVEFYTWPLDRRPSGVRAFLHAKAIVADATAAFITSANVSSAALDHSLELGVLIHGGPVPRRLADHLHGLIASGELRRQN